MSEIVVVTHYGEDTFKDAYTSWKDTEGRLIIRKSVDSPLWAGKKLAEYQEKSVIKVLYYDE